MAPGDPSTTSAAPPATPAVAPAPQPPPPIAAADALGADALGTDDVGLRRELALERVRRQVFESVAREELLARTLQCLADMVEREAPRVSVGIWFDPQPVDPSAPESRPDNARPTDPRSNGPRSSDGQLSCPLPSSPLPSDPPPSRPAPLPNLTGVVAGRLGRGAVAAAGQALPGLCQLCRPGAGGARFQRLSDGGPPEAVVAALRAVGRDPADAGWVVPLAGPAASGADPAVEPAPLGALLILIDGAASPTPAERSLAILAAELAAFAVAHRRQAATAARRLMHDALTGLPNATLMLDRLGQAVEASRRQRFPLAVLLVDLDGLRAVNESAGRAAGDDVLRQIADRLRGTVRRSDTAARTVGDAFALVAPVTGGRRDAVILARKLLAVIAQPVSVAGREVAVGAAVGVSVFPDDAADAPALVDAAEVALRRAKGQGRNAIEVFEPAAGSVVSGGGGNAGGRDPSGLADLEMEGQLRRAIETAVRRQAVAAFEPPAWPLPPSAAAPTDGSTTAGAGAATLVLEPAGTLALHYQPQVDTAGRLLGVEALARWSHPTLGRVPPDRFIAVAERSGLIVPFGAWALREAVNQARAWYDAFGPAAPRVAVNVSAVQFAEPRFVESVERLLAVARLKPGLLELEITETMLMRDADESAAKIARLRAAGLSVALDDFGTGYSSLAYLHRLTLDTLKVDRSFVAAATGGGRRPPGGGAPGAPGAAGPAAVGTGAGSPGGAAITRAIVSMGRSLGMTVLAEGVETDAQRQLLSRLGCELMQGYLFSPPVAAEGVTAMLTAGGVLSPQAPTTAKSA